MENAECRRQNAEYGMRNEEGLGGRNKEPDGWSPGAWLVFG